MPNSIYSESRMVIAEHDIKHMSKLIEETRMSIDNFKKEHMAELKETRSEFKTDMAELRADIDDSMEKQNKVLSDIHERVKDLDKWRWIVVGAAAIIGFILSKLTNFFGYNLH